MKKGDQETKDSAPSGLVTSQDLFGDIVDAPMPGRKGTESATRQEPVRVQVTEPGQPVKELPPGPTDVLPDEVAALLDAFSGPAEEAARAEIRPTPRETKPAPAPTKTGPVTPLVPPRVSKTGPVVPLVPASPLEPKTAPAPTSRSPKTAPVAKAKTTEPESSVAVIQPPAPKPLSARSGPVAAKPTDPVRSVPPQKLFDAITIEPFNDAGEELHDLNLDELTPAPPWREGSSRGNRSAPEEPPSAPKTVLPPETKVARPSTVPPDGGSVEEKVALDLAALAEDAFSARSGGGPTQQPVARENMYGPYRLIEKLAVGGMAEVFKAKRSGVEGFEKVVAVKRILAHLSENKEFVDMFVDEAKMVAGLTHPNIVQIYDLGKIERSYYIAMEYVHGRDLRTIMRRAKERGIRIPLDISAYIVSRVCTALDYAHRKKDDEGRSMRIVHRDVSPQNILISFDGDVKLTDFGIAKAASKATSTERGALRGKLLYMSPEQAWGRSMDGRSDVFSLGIVFYEMVTEAKPFLASSEMSILEAVRECRLTSPTVLNPRIPQRLERVVLKALEKDPDQRYQDAADMARDVELALGQRKPPTATELARFMEILFDADERGVTALPQEELSAEEELSPKKLEVEFEQTPGRATSVAETPTPPVVGTKDMSIDKLLKRFGIK